MENNPFSDISDLPLWQENEAFSVLEKFCFQHGVPVDTLKELVSVERQHQHRERAHGINDEFDSIFEQMD